MGKLDGKVAIVTGGASGIGRATVELFVREGAKVLSADWDEKGTEVVAGMADAAFLKVDVSSAEDVQRMVAEAVKRFGGLDILFNNAGIEGDQALSADCTIENFDRVIAVNLKGVFLGTKYAIPEMLKRGGGSIINTASIAGLVGFPNIPAYCASKGGVVQLTKVTALEYATQGIRVNAICPGVIWTPMVERFTSVDSGARAAFEAAEPVGRFGTSEEVAQMALYLASDDSKFCTGAPFIIDGGWVAR
jgi:NAD(P)-dependent dehydrogenase (short-subunit alcohol dehydrogenase family)